MSNARKDWERDNTIEALLFENKELRKQNKALKSGLETTREAWKNLKKELSSLFE